MTERTQTRASAGARYSLVVPIYRNEHNVDDLVVALREFAERHRRLEVILVDDGSPDRSRLLLENALRDAPFAVRIIRLSRNFGSFAAIRVGIEHARGDYIAVMAADLQEPPELVDSIFATLASEDVDIVFGQRTGRADGLITRMSSAAFWSIYRRFVIADVPVGGVDIFGCTAEVAKSLLAMREHNSSLLAQLFWVGYRRAFVPYERRAREKGKSGWSFRRRLRYMVDSIFAFTDLPILVVLWVGAFGLASSLLIGLVTIAARLIGLIDVPGYATVVLVTLFFGSVNLFIQGILGLYLWRMFENTKQRPLAIVADAQSLGAKREEGKLDG